jgi:hypothetical protein
VEDQLGTRPLEHVGDRLCVAYIGDLKPGAPSLRRFEVGALAGGQVVDHRHAVAALQQRVDEV